jgi:hypothetical protein
MYLQQLHKLTTKFALDNPPSAFISETSLKEDKSLSRPYRHTFV